MPRDERPSPVSRRSFLATSAAGAGLTLMTGFLARCGAGLAQVAGPLEDSGLTGHFARFGVDEALLRATLAVATSRGGDFAELYFQHRDRNYLGVEDGQVDRAYAVVDLGCGVRVVKGDQQGFAFTEDLTPQALRAAALTAAGIANGQPVALPALRRVEPPAFYPIRQPWATVSIERKIPLVAAADQAARALDPRIVKVSVFLVDSTEHVLIATSDGRVTNDFQPMGETYVTCVAEHQGRRETNYEARSARRGFEMFSEDVMRDLARKAAEKTVLQFAAAPPPAGEYPVVLAPGLTGILLHEAMGHGFEADFNRKGQSVFSTRVGQKIAPDFVTIVDDATNPHERGTLNVDDEGTTGQRTVLVENGVLRSFMHDRISSAHYGLASTGNGRRECYRFPPVPRMRNTYMLNGPHDPGEIVRSVKKGLYAVDFANGQVRIGSGDFSFYLKHGFLIEDGRLTRPVKDANLIGFGPKVLEKIELVGNDLALFSGPGYCGKDGQQVPVGFGLPTVLCAGISTGGV
jgi:TldD protein